MSRSTVHRPLLFSLCLTVLCFGIAAHAAEEANRSTAPASPARPAADPLAPPGIVKPVIPNKSEMAESAFKKLDAASKGYVTKEDTSGLEGFDRAFRSVDTGHSGKLDLQQFKKAWAEYSGYKQ